MNKLFLWLPFDGAAAGFTGADGADDVVSFAAVRAFNDMWC